MSPVRPAAGAGGRSRRAGAGLLPGPGGDSWLPALQLVAFWPVWVWYLERVADGSDEPLGPLALVTAGVIAWRSSAVDRVPARHLVLPTLLTLLYIVAVPITTPLPRAILAVAAIGCLVSSRFGRSVEVGLAGLLVLSLPVVASLQFYAGYPARFATGWVAAHLLSLAGVPVDAAGAYLVWRGEPISIDAPCSGIKMLWAALYLNFTLSCCGRLGPLAAWAGHGAAMLAVFAGNVLRAAALFFLETGLVKAPSGSHQAIGLVAFAAVSAMILLVHRVLRHRPAPPRSAAASPPDSGPWAARLRGLFLAALAAAALAPLAAADRPARQGTAGFPGWPATLEGRPLAPVALSAAERAFQSGFPGLVARFDDGAHEVIVRWVSRATRRLHPSADCLRAGGWSVDPRPVWSDVRGRHWSRFEARRAGITLEVRERIVDAEGNGFPDPSTWYWAWLLGRTRGPWWAYTVARRVAGEAQGR